MNPLNNPDLAPLQAAADVANVSDQPARLAVPALVTLTPPMEQHKAPKPAYFICTFKTASMHRPDGKKLPFVQGMLKTEVVEDIAYLRAQIVNGIPYIREASEKETDEIESTLNPRASLEKQVRAKVENELRETLEQEIRAKLLAEMAASKTDAAKLAGVDTGTGIMAKPDPGQVSVTHLNPVSSASLAGNAAPSDSSFAARAAAALAAAKTK